MKKNKITKNKITIFLIINLLLYIFQISSVKANEKIDITNNSTIKYKWYIEEKNEGKYYPKGEKLEGYYEDIDNINYGPQTEWSTKYCQYSREKYDVEMDIDRVYKKVIDTRYIKIIGAQFTENIKIFTNTNQISYSIIKKTNNETIIDLKKLYEVGKLWFYLEEPQEFDIYLAFNDYFTSMSLYKHIVNERLVIPDKTWIYEKTGYGNLYTHETKTNNDFLTYTGQRVRCRVREIQTYRYKINKVYYDNQYHEKIKDYLPDYENYLIEYTGSLPTNTINITKTIKEIVPIKEYIYIDELENTESNHNDENKDTCLAKEVVKTKYIENEVIKKVKVVPKIMYLIISLLVLIITMLIIKLVKKCRLK